MNILELTKFMSLKELKTYLNDHLIDFSEKHGHISFSYSFFDTTFEVKVNSVKDVIFSFALEIKPDEYDYSQIADKMLEIKEKLISVLGQPTLDNTNHLNKNDISVRFFKDNISCGLSCTNNSETEDNQAYIYIADTTVSVLSGKKSRKKSFLTLTVSLVLFSLIGGFIWGLAMYGLMGLMSDDFSSSSFGLWMMGGLLFGVLFALVFSGIITVGKRLPKNNYRHLLKIFDLKNCPEVYTGNSICRNKGKNGRYDSKVYPTLLQVKDSDVIIHLVKKGKPRSLKISPMDACKGSIFGLIEYEADNDICEFVFSDYSFRRQFEDDLCSRFIDRNDYDTLFECLKKAIYDYNPHSVYNTNDSGFLDKNMGIITYAFLISDNISEETLLQLVSDTFSYNDFTTVELTGLLNEAFIDWKNTYDRKNK